MKVINIKRKGLMLIMILSSVMMNACFDDAFEGVNTDPLAATVADPATILPLVLVEIGNSRTSELGIRASDIPEYYGQGFSGAAVGSPSPAQVGNVWVTRYATVLGNLEIIRLQTSENPLSDQIRAVSMILQQFAYLELTQVYEDIPYTQALDATEFPAPLFDTQETVLRGIVVALEEAKGVIDNASAGQLPLQGDLYFSGDIPSWRRLATSLQIRALMLIRNQDTGVDTQLGQLFADGPIETNAEVPMLRYVASPANDNPYKQVIDDFFGGSNITSETWSPRNTMINPMNNTNDPRRRLWFTTATSNGLYVGLTTRGFPTSGASTSLFRDDNLLRGDLPDVLFTPSEIDLYQAELMLLGAIPGGVAGADEAYRRGTRLAVEMASNSPGAVDNLTTTEIDTFIDGLPNLTTLSDQDALEAVYLQLYIDAFLRVIEGWTTVRRTGFPAIETPPASTLSDYTKRFFYPVAEESSNPNTPSSKALDVAHWFEK